MVFRLIFLFAIVCHGWNQPVIGKCLLKMGFREENKPPYMNQSPDNRGLYFDLYDHAAKLINCKLKIVRGPKKRILAFLEDGKIDFYPSFNFTLKRKKYVHYIPTGLTKRLVGITRNDFPDITDLSQLNGYTALLALGSVNRYQRFEGIKVFKVQDLTIQKVVSLLKLKRGDYYIGRQSEFLYFLKKNPAYNNIVKSSQCCGTNEPIYLAFSRKSLHYRDKINPNFDKTKQLSPTNLKVSIISDSIPYQFQQELKNMELHGITKKIYDKHFRLSDEKY